MTPTFFTSPSALRKWFQKNHNRETELLIGFYKVESGKPSITWSQSVDEALCFGWIDGIRRSIDKDSYTIRFTPRKPKSIWSAINIKKIDALTKLGLIQPAGQAAYEKREEKKSKIYTYENAPVIYELTRDFEKQLKADKNAWKFFQSQPPHYKRNAIYWVMSAKQEATRKNRLLTLIKDSSASRKIKPLSYASKKY